MITLKEKNAFQNALTLEPAIIRGAVVSVTSVVAVLVGHNIDLPWLDQLLSAYAALSALVAGVFIRGAVTPVAGLKAISDLNAVLNPVSAVTNGPIPPVSNPASVTPVLPNHGEG